MTYRKKLIEVALPLEDINREAAREKSIRHGHPSTLHLWWARRPLAACRAVLFASLLDDPSGYVPELMADQDKMRAAEKTLAVQRKAWKERKLIFDKARAAGLTTVPDPGPEPKLEDILEERERERLFDVIRELVKWENSNEERVLTRARGEIARSVARNRGETAPQKPAEVLAYLAKNAPPVYDPFCGGGSIPLEAHRLGLKAHASDLNPVPVLITKALIEIPSKFTSKPPVNPDSRSKFGITGTWKGVAGLAEDIRYYGKWMRDQAEKRIGHLYPSVRLPSDMGGGDAKVVAWLWARTVRCPNPACGAEMPLVRSFALSSKRGAHAFVVPVINGPTYKFTVAKSGEAPSATVDRNGARCICCKAPAPLEYVRSEGRAGRMSARLMAIVAEGLRVRQYLSPTQEQERIARDARPAWMPETQLPSQALSFRVQTYGMTHHRDLFTARQLVAMTTFSDLINQARVHVKRDALAAGMDAHGAGLEQGGVQAEAYADALATYLAFATSRTSDTCNTLCRWQDSHTRVLRLFARQAIPMVWNFAEPNVFAEGLGDLQTAVDTVATCVENLFVGASPCDVRQADAMQGPAGVGICSTDPPYYDNIGYADLSDFFYAWLRPSLLSIYPQLLSTLQVPKKDELVATPFRFGGNRDAARRFFEDGLGRTFAKILASHDARYPFTVYYAFKQKETDDSEDLQEEETQVSTGWETMLEGLLQAGFSIDGTWPMRSELPSRMIAIGTNALASSIVLVCRPKSKNPGVISRRDFLASLKKELPQALRHLQNGNIAPVDLAQAAIGPGMAVFSRYARVLETDGSPMSVRTALALINQMLDEVLAEQEGEFDADTRWALAWFDQFGFAEGPYGQAETLSTAKNTSVSGMVDAGILAAKGGKVRLLKKDELSADWDPATDKRLTIWETTHHLIRRLDQGESSAAKLIQKLGPIAETARDLAYRLYTICDRRKWAQEAIGYNALVLAWPDLIRLAEEHKAAVPAQGEMQL